MQGLEIYESELCECGLHESIAQTDPDMEIQLPRCPVCAGIAQKLRVLSDNDEKAMKVHGDKPAASTPRPDDGRSVRLVHKSPPDDETKSTHN